MISIYLARSRLKKILRAPWKIIQRLPAKATLAVARIANRLLPFVSIERSRLYPPKISCLSTLDWVAEFGRKMGADIQTIDAAYTILNKSPKTVHEHVRRTLLMDQEYPGPQTFVATLPRGRVYDPGIIITPDDKLLDDVSIDFSGSVASRLANLSSRWSPKRIRQVDGTVAVLSTMGGNLYYHWLFQLLPRFELIRRAGIDLSTIDYFLVDGLDAPFQRESMEALAIESSKIIVSSPNLHLRAQKLIVPSVPLSGGCFAPWMCEFLRSTFLTANAPPGHASARRIYITRGSAGYRRVLNEDDVVQLLNRYGFEAVSFETLTVRQQASLMASSEVVIGPHGGGLCNLAFCSPTTKVIEIFSPELVAAYYWKLSNALGLDYYYMLGKGPAAALESNYDQSWDARVDIEVDLQVLENTLGLAGIV